METNLKKVMHQSAARIFEEICFMFEAPELEEEQTEAKVEAAVSVDFHGPVEGSIIIKVYEGMLSAIAANMLGEEDTSKQQQLDALGEIANVICGNALPLIAGSKEVFHVDAPQIIEVSDLSDKSRKDPVAEAQVVLDQGKADLMLYITSKVTLSE